MQNLHPDLHSLRLINWLGIAIAVAVVSIFTWLLLIPDPYAASRSFEPLRRAQISGYLIHPCVYFCMVMVSLVNVPCGSQRAWNRVLLLFVVHGLVTEVLQHFIPGRSCDPLDSFANLSGIAVAVVADRVRRDVFGAYSRAIGLAYID